MEMVDLNLKPTSVPEWEAEDIMSAELGEETKVLNDDEKQQLLEGITLRLPKDIDATELVQYTASHATPISPAAALDVSHFNFYLIQVPVQIVIPDEKKRIVRLRLVLNMTPDTYQGTPIIAYDLYPQTITKDDIKDFGEVDIDVAKALKFVPLLSPVADALGIKLKFPLEWKTTNIVVQTAGLLSNPIDWYVTDEAIQNGFRGYAIIKAPKQADVDISAQIVFELVEHTLLGQKKGPYEADTQTYHIKVTSPT